MTTTIEPRTSVPPHGPGAGAAPHAPQVAVSLAGGFIAAQAVYSFAKLGISDALGDRTATVGEIAATAGTDTAATYRLLRSLGAFGAVDEVSPGTFRLTDVGQLFRNRPGSLADLTMMWMETHYAWFGGLQEAVADGRPAFDRIEGRSYWEWLEDHAPEKRLFTRAMASLGAQTEQAAVDAYDFSPFSRFVDVAGAHGSLLSTVLDTVPGASGVLFDLPHVVATAGDALRARGQQERIELVGGDFFDGVPAGGDAYLLRFILHDWEDPDCVRILRSIRAAIPDDGTLVVIESVIPPGNQPHLGKLLDMVTLAIVPGQERTAGEFSDLFSRAGFRLEEIVPTAAPTSILVARPI